MRSGSVTRRKRVPGAIPAFQSLAPRWVRGTRAGRCSATATGESYGAARVALGPQLPALFCRGMALARELVDRSLELQDPMWHLPLWAGYHRSIESDIADIVNTGKGPMAGAITAALFLG